VRTSPSSSLASQNIRLFFRVSYFSCLYIPLLPIFISISDVFVNFLLYLWVYGWMKVILTLMTCSLFVFPLPFWRVNTNFFRSHFFFFFLLYKKPSFFLLFNTILDGWVDGRDEQTFIPCRCLRFFFPLMIFSFSYRLLALVCSLFSCTCEGKKERKGRGVLRFFFSFSIYYTLTFTISLFYIHTRLFPSPPSTWLYTDTHTSIYLAIYFICLYAYLCFFFFFFSVVTGGWCWIRRGFGDVRGI